jgi:putative intracellular protease/amidase
MVDILMVLTAHDTLGRTGDRTGVWLEDVAPSYYMLTDAGMHVTLASLPGGPAPVDPRRGIGAEASVDMLRFLSDADARAALDDTHRLDRLNVASFNGVFYPGGTGALWDLAESSYSASVIAAAYGAGIPIAFCGSGVAALINAASTDGGALIAGRHVTGLSDSELSAAGLTHVVPFSLQQRLASLGAIYRYSADGSACVVTDGTLITGQNSASIAGVVRALLALAFICIDSQRTRL